MDINDKLHDKLDSILADLTAIKIDIVAIKKDMARNTDDLERHMEQTRLLKAEMNSRVAPIESHVVFVGNALKVITVAASIVIFLKQIGVL